MDKQFPSSMKAELTKLLSWNVENQFDIAKALAANCGYQLVAEDNERSLEIKNLIAYINANEPRGWKLIVEGLEALLK